MRNTKSWSDITVGQFLELHKLSISDLDEMDKVEKAVSIIYDMTERQVEEMRMADFTALSANAARFLTDKVPGKAEKQIKVGRKRYQITYDPTKLKHRQYVEVMTWGAEPILNMHLIMASVVRPVASYGRILKNKAEDHPRITADILKAPVTSVIHTCVFFCNLYVNSIEATRAYLVREIMEKGVTREEAEAAVQISISAMAGFIPPGRLQTITGSL